MVRVIRLKEYLQQVNVAVSKSPPMIHSTSAHRLIDIIGSGKLLAMPCNVFAGDKLCYCFLGRPAYKGPSVESPSEWQRHQEVLAVARLFQEHSSARCDDRSAAIEMQIEADITLAKDNLLGVVIPEEFKRTPGLMQALKSIAGHVQTYPHFPLGTQEHYALIYDRVNNIYKKSGINL